jgi:membrane-bound lytic murein transglycosylase D
LRNLNPRLDPQASQPQGTRILLPKLLERPYEARCVDGPWPILANDLHTAVLPVAPPDPPSAPSSKPANTAKTRSYVVKRGDTLTGIVSKLGCSSVQEVAQMNGLNHQHIKPGQSLKLPSCR